jgi:hypothetical protein
MLSKNPGGASMRGYFMISGYSKKSRGGKSTNRIPNNQRILFFQVISNEQLRSFP